MKYPQLYFISSGTGHSAYRLVAFDDALGNAGIGNYNLLKVSSILPAGAKRAEKVELREGSALLTAYARAESNVPGAQIATAVGAAIPCNDEDVGVIMECSDCSTAREAEATIKAMCAEAMERRGTPYREILVSSAEAVVADNEYTALISAIALW